MAAAAAAAAIPVAYSSLLSTACISSRIIIPDPISRQRRSDYSRRRRGCSPDRISHPSYLSVGVHLASRHLGPSSFTRISSFC